MFAVPLTRQRFDVFLVFHIIIVKSKNCRSSVRMYFGFSVVKMLQKNVFIALFLVAPVLIVSLCFNFFSLVNVLFLGANRAGGHI